MHGLRKIHIPRIEIAAPKSGSGKTLLTVGLLAALKSIGKNPCSFKCGPDFIDPMFHREVLGIHSGNLDSYFIDDDTLRHIMLSEYKDAGADIAVIEGVMGFFDGLGGTHDEASSYEISCITKTPVLLILDAKGASLSLVPLIKGFLSYRDDADIAGIVLNRVSALYFPVLKKMIEEECGVKVLGFLPEDRELVVPSRHLGLISPDEAMENNDFVSEAEKLVRENVDVDKIIEIAEGSIDLSDRFDADKLKGTAYLISPDALKISEKACDIEDKYILNNATYVNSIANTMTTKPNDTALEGQTNYDNGNSRFNSCNNDKSGKNTIRIAVARDEAFSFYYEENLNLLRELGAEILFFSPLHDKEIPDDINGLYLGGGYPELYAKELSENTLMKASIRKLIESGLPTIAECGGFLYLCDSLENEKMTGLFSCHAEKKEHLVRFGYVEGVSKKDGLFGPAGTSLRGHEFHYFDTEDNGDGFLMTKPVNRNSNDNTAITSMTKSDYGKSWDAMHYSDTFAIGFPHFYWYSNVNAIKNFIKSCHKEPSTVFKTNLH